MGGGGGEGGGVWGGRGGEGVYGGEGGGRGWPLVFLNVKRTRGSSIVLQFYVQFSIAFFEFENCNIQKNGAAFWIFHKKYKKLYCFLRSLRRSKSFFETFVKCRFFKIP